MAMAAASGSPPQKQDSITAHEGLLSGIQQFTHDIEATKMDPQQTSSSFDAAIHLQKYQKPSRKILTAEMSNSRSIAELKKPRKPRIFKKARRPFKFRIRLEKPHFRLGDLPTDIIFLVFDALYYSDEAIFDEVCLGLTCRRFYAIMKTFLPSPIALWILVSGRTMMVEDAPTLPAYAVRLPDEILAERLKAFMGPNYRLVEFTGQLTNRYCPVFLNVQVYKTEPGEKQQSLQRKYEAYLDWYWYERHFQDHTDCPESDVRMLPSPHDSGDEWYSKAYNIVTRLSFTTEEWDTGKVPETKRDLRLIRDSDFGRDIMERFMWEALDDWHELLNNQQQKWQSDTSEKQGKISLTKS